MSRLTDFLITTIFALLCFIIISELYYLDAHFFSKATVGLVVVIELAKGAEVLQDFVEKFLDT